MKRFHAALVALTLTGSIALAAGIASASAAETGTKVNARQFGVSTSDTRRNTIITDTRDPITDTHDLTTRDLTTDMQVSIITDTRDPITDTDDLTTRDLTDTHQEPIITDTRDPITRALSGGTTITPPAIISLMTPTTGPPLKTWRRLVGKNPNNPYRGTIWYGVAPYWRIADAMCRLAASALY